MKVHTPSDNNKNIVIPVSGEAKRSATYVYDSMKTQNDGEHSISGSLIDDELEEIRNEQAEALIPSIPRDNSGITNSENSADGQNVPSSDSINQNTKTDIFDQSHIIEGEDIQK